MDTLAAQLLHLWLKEHHIKGAERLHEAENQKSAVRLSLLEMLYKQDLNNDNINRYANEERKKNSHQAPTPRQRNTCN